MLYVSRSARTAAHQPRDREADQEGQTRPAQRAQAAAARHGRVGQVDVHQADAHHSRLGILRRGQAHVHQARLSEHLHGHELHD